MTEAEWLAANSPWRMLRSLQFTQSDRKQRLAAVAICRHIWHLLTDERSRHAVLVGERYADGLAEKQELLGADTDADAACHETPSCEARAAWFVSSDTCYYLRNEGMPRIDNHHRGPLPQEVSTQAIDAVLHSKLVVAPAMYTTWVEDEVAEQAAHIALIREIFGNPFRPVAVNPEWRTSTVMQLARGIYDNRNFSDLPILADALQDAGCDCDDILNHLRDANATHVRGCWALDLVLGKE